MARYRRPKPTPPPPPLIVMPSKPRTPAPTSSNDNNNRRPSRRDRNKKNGAEGAGILIPNPSDVALFNDKRVAQQIMADLVFENIGGQELLSIARNDTINGQEILYQPIKNLSGIADQYNSSTLIPVEGDSASYFENFSIKLDERIPSVGYGPNGTFVYTIANGDVIIDVVNLEADEQVEVEIFTDGDLIDYTNYEVQS